MAKYTTTIQEYCQGVYLAQQLELNPDADAWSVVSSMDDSDYYRIVRDYLMPSEWPFYNESTLDKQEFLEEWTDKFLYYEIGQDSMGRFRHMLKAWLRINMPYYADLFASRVDGSKLNMLMDNVNVTVTRTGEQSKKNGTYARQGATTYGRTDTFTPGKTNKNSIVALGSASTEKELNQTTEGGLETNVSSGTDTNGFTDTYTNLKDEVNITEKRQGGEHVDVAGVLEKYRALILDLNCMIFDKMKADGLFMMVW